jgi:tRNA(Ile)-lysidine synthase
VHESWIQEVEYRIQSLSRELGRRWVVAVSGGSDSVGLLRVLHSIAPTTGLKLSVAHLDHGTRGESGQADASFVSELAKTLEIPFDHGYWQPTRSAHFEADARKARYQWLTEVAKMREATVIAVAHTADDQAETILHRIIRGTGPRGLSGIPERRCLATNPDVTLVRPLLDVNRETIRDELSRIGQSFREDETNADLKWTRSRIRHDLMPKLRAEYNPRITEALIRLGHSIAGSNAAVSSRIQELGNRIILETTADTARIVRHDLSSLSPFLAIEVLRLAWHRCAWPEREMSKIRWERLRTFAGRSGRRSHLSIGSGIEAWLVNDELVLRRT